MKMTTPQWIWYYTYTTHYIIRQSEPAHDIAHWGIPCSTQIYPEYVIYVKVFGIEPLSKPHYSKGTALN